MKTQKTELAEEQNLEEAAEYTRRVYDHTLEWYRNADTKAEIILALDGIFLSLLTSSIFMDSSNLAKILASFSPITWMLLMIMALSLIGSVFCAIGCLWSRVSSSKKAKAHFLASWQIKPDKAKTLKPEVTWFFQNISWLEANAYKQYLLEADKKFEIQALGHNLPILSQNVLKKHRLVDWSFLLGGSSLVLFFCMGINYIIIVK